VCNHGHINKHASLIIIQICYIYSSFIAFIALFWVLKVLYGRGDLLNHQLYHADIKSKNAQCPLNSPFVTLSIKNIGLRRPQSQPCLSSTAIQRRDHTNVIPSDNSMCAGNEQLFERWGEFFTTKIEHTHGTSTDIGCEVWLHFRGGYRGKHQEFLRPCGSTHPHDAFTSVYV